MITFLLKKNNFYVKNKIKPFDFIHYTEIIFLSKTK